MTKNANKKAEQKRQKKLAKLKKKRSQKSTIKRQTQPKDVNVNEILRLTRKMQNTGDFTSPLLRLSNLLKDSPYFASLHYDPIKTKAIMTQFVQNHADVIASVSFDGFIKLLDKDVFPRLAPISYKWSANEIMERACRSPQFVGEDHEAILFGFLMIKTSLEAQKLSPDEPIPPDINDIMWFLMLHVTIDKLAKSDPEMEVIFDNLRNHLNIGEFNEYLAKTELESEDADAVEDEDDEDEDEDEDEEELETEYEEIKSSQFMEIVEEVSPEVLAEARTQIAFRLTVADVIRAIPFYNDIQTLTNYHQFNETLQSDPDRHRLLLFPIIADFRSEAALRYETHLKENPSPVADKALNCFRNVPWSKNPFIIDLYLVSLHEVARSDNEFVRALFANPSEINTYLQFGNQLLTNGQVRECIKVTKRALELDGENWRGYRQLALCHEQLNEWEHAEENFSMAIDFAEDALAKNQANVTVAIIAEINQDLARVDAHL